MPKKDYIPRIVSKFVAWGNKFCREIANYAATFGIQQSEIIAIASEAANTDTLYEDMEDKKDEYQAAVKAFYTQMKKETDIYRPFIKRIKAHPNYTEAIGEKLDIIGEEEIIDWSNVKPELKAKAEVSGVTIKFKIGYAERMNVYCRRGNEVEFTFLATDTHPPYHDTRPNLVVGTPEKREYTAAYVHQDIERGLRSDVVSIMV